MIKAALREGPDGLPFLEILVHGPLKPKEKELAAQVRRLLSAGNTLNYGNLHARTNHTFCAHDETGTMQFKALEPEVEDLPPEA